MNLFSKLISTYKKMSEKDKGQSMTESKYMPEEEIPVDEQFMLNFKEKGGKFLYCDSIEDAQNTFKNILSENNWHKSEVCCFEPEIVDTFDSFNLKFNKNSESIFYISTCEYLIADCGGILVSSNQLKEKKLKELPDNMVVIAYTSQLIRDISSGLKGIKNRKGENIPTNITTIKLFESQKENNFLTYGSSAKNLYLLLVEDL